MEVSFVFEVKNSKLEIFKNLVPEKVNGKVTTSHEKGDKLDVDINKVWDSVDNFLDLGDSNVFSWIRLNEAEQKKYWEVVSKLIKSGIIGYRYYEVNGNLERHFIEWEIANPRLKNVKVKYIDKKQYSLDFLV